ncbi:hypothetical protein [Rossellomorea vietnamensis]|uniref:hypothetical protein n=1 Tax=Rossellomorea vietnamensis TaxID=218284 RepID=UPI00207850D5
MKAQTRIILFQSGYIVLDGKSITKEARRTWREKLLARVKTEDMELLIMLEHKNNTWFQ